MLEGIDDTNTYTQDKCDASLNDPLVLMYTSGTTGQPKGALLSNLNILHAIVSYKKTLGLNYDDTTIIPIPIFNVTGLIALMALLFISEVKAY